MRLASGGGVNETEWLKLLEKVARLLVEDLVQIGRREDVTAVVRRVDGNGNLVGLGESIGLLEQALGGGWRAADSDSHDADSADVSTTRSGDASGGVESIEGGSRILFGSVCDNGRPAGTRVGSLFDDILCGADGSTGAESDADGLDGERDQLAQGTGRGDGCSSEETSAETDRSGVLDDWSLRGALLKVAGRGGELAGRKTRWRAAHVCELTRLRSRLRVNLGRLESETYPM